MKFLALALALLAPLPASADAPAGGAPGQGNAQSIDSYRPQVEDVQRTAANPFATPYTIWEKNQALPFDNVRVNVDVSGIRGWDMGGSALGDGTKVEAHELASYGIQKVTDLGIGVPEPLRDSVADLSTLQRNGGVREASNEEMGENQMGRFKYTESDRSTGETNLHEIMTYVAGIIGKNFAFSTYAHEARHLYEHRRGRLSGAHEIDNEIVAFRTQYDWLAQIDPYGERLPYARAWVDNMIRRHGHGRVIDASQRYLTHLAELRATGGEERPLRELVERYGYEEGGHNHGAPNTQTAALPGPTRS